MAGHLHGAGKRADRFEETLIAIILGLMTLITFANVIVRYVFNASYFQPITNALGLPTSILWGLETTLILFAWLVILGISYCVKINGHLGVDAILNIVDRPVRRGLTLLAVFLCLVYSFLLLKGGWDFWANFANLPQTTGRWFPTGLEDKFLGKGWYETNDIQMPGFMQFLADWFNEGEKYEKLPRFIPYVVVPFGFALLLFRFFQIGLQVIRGQRDMIIVSHEAEEAVEDAAAQIAREEAKIDKGGQS